MQDRWSDRNAEEGWTLCGRAERMTRGRVIGTIIVLLVVVTCVRLGLWQLDRLQQKRTRNAALVERTTEPAVAISGAVRDSTGLINRRAVAHGHYDNERSIVLPGRSYRGSPGVQLLTPLLIPDAPALLVQRGWVPTADAATIPFEAFAVDTAVALDGIILPFLGADNTLAVRAGDVQPADTFRRVWYAIDEERLRAQYPYPLLPFRLQLVPGANSRAAGYPLAQDASTLDEGPHLGYAIQWFSFALIFLIGWLVLLLRGSGRAAVRT